MKLDYTRSPWRLRQHVPFKSRNKIMLQRIRIQTNILWITLAFKTWRLITLQHLAILLVFAPVCEELKSNWSPRGTVCTTLTMWITDSQLTICSLTAVSAWPRLKVNAYRLMVRENLEAGGSNLLQGIISMLIPFGNRLSNNSKILERYRYQIPSKVFAVFRIG